jgi:HSP20 family protein
MSNNRESARKAADNEGIIVPSSGTGGRGSKRGQQQPLAERNSTYLANNLDRMFEDFRSSFNQLMMPVITAWSGDPFSLASLQSLPEWIDTSAHVHQSRYPVLDIVDQGDYYEVTAELPGFNKDNVNIQVGDDTLQLTAQVQSEHKGGKYMSHERSYSAFQRVIQFPEQVVGTKVDGTMKDGILSLKVPKKEPTSVKYTRVALK